MVAAEFMRAMFENLRAENTQERIVLFMDNASFHHASFVKQMCQRYGIDVLFTAPYSPNMNPIEYLFASIKRVLRFKPPTTE